MSSMESEAIKDHKRRPRSWAAKTVQNWRLFKMRLKSRDSRTIVAVLVLVVMVVSVWINAIVYLNNRALSRHEQQLQQKVDAADLATKDLMGLDKNFHDLLNRKVLPQGEHRASEFDGIGFGNAAMRRLHHKPGTPPMPKHPGILNQLDDVHSQASDASSKSASSSISTFWKGQPKRKIYVVLGKNQETGIKNRKRREHWLIEKFSIVNKRHYAEKHGYELIITSATPYTKGGQVSNVNVLQKRYQHETREGWEKFDLMRTIMRQTSTDVDPEEVEQWYWYIDMNTLIMEPEYSIEELILEKLDSAYRDMDYFDPNNLYGEQQTKEKKDFYDDDDNSIDLILTQDCKGINLNSFLIKKSHWSNLLLDVLWEPVFYKQMHLKWLSDSSGSSKYGFTLNSQEHTDYGYNNDREEKNCLEFLINTQSWIRSKIGFLPVRVFNSLSKDFCNEDEDDDISSMEDLINIDNSQQKASVDSNTNLYLSNKANFHYNETDRDFLVNFMMCERHNNCWERFQQFSKINEKLHRSWLSNWFK